MAQAVEFADAGKAAALGKLDVPELVAEWASRRDYWPSPDTGNAGEEAVYAALLATVPAHMDLLAANIM